VNLIVPARYGYEYLLMQLSSKLKEKIFIHEAEVYEQYSLISLLDACVTTNERGTRIFLKPTFVTNSLHKFADKDVVMNLQLSAMFWTNWKQGAPFVLKTGQRSYRVCYATHNSFNEIRDFLLFIRPKKVYLNVVPDDVLQKRRMFKELETIQNQYLEGEKKKAEEVIPQTKFSFKRLRSMSSRREAKTLNAEKKLKRSQK
jgi:DNA repair metallo-beta-lactamase